MLCEKQTERMLSKLKKFETVLEHRLFQKVGEVSMERYETSESFDALPANAAFLPCKTGDTWGQAGGYCWFHGTYTVPQELDGKNLFLYPHIEGYEAMLFVNGMPFGTFCTKIVITGHGNHYCDLLKKDAKAGEVIDIALEYYAGHFVIGCDPWSKDPERTYHFRIDTVDVCLKDEVLQDFYFDLKTVNQMAACLDKDSFRRADLIRTLEKVHTLLYYSAEDTTEELFYDAIRSAAVLLKEQLKKKNSETAPSAGLIGHSHMDTAWLWHRGETIKKCARTYSNELSLMEQYPEYTFIQSSAYHSQVIKEHYPQLFEAIKKRVAEGRYEPNGGVYIECDCNITSGESMIRQFLWGQRFTRKEFGYTANAFWLPDTFGYSASIPQIMKGCHVDYFLTTKITWNDTTVFPYDTFYWKGIDGTRVFTHFNCTHLWPDPKNLLEKVVHGENSLKEKTVTDKRLLSYGFGDGGGGPQFEMIEMARRLTDNEGLPKAKHTSVGDFMKELEATASKPSEHRGELYLELHRGTLTNQHTIKRNNRKAEIALHNLEYLTVRDAVEKQKAADASGIAPLTQTLLINQFHDILPGTCIPRAHQESIAETTALIRTAEEKINELLPENKEDAHITLSNTLSFARKDVVYLENIPEDTFLAGSYPQQHVTGLDGRHFLAVSGVNIPAFSSVTLPLTTKTAVSRSPFKRENNRLITPHAKVTFTENGTISSFIDRSCGRELCGEGYPFNTFLLAEDLPDYWDNWDIDADVELKFKDCAVLLSSEVVADGPVEYRIRNTYRLTEKSSIVQDMIFNCENADIRFDTEINWQDNHRFLKTAFDTAVYADYARQEIQFGCVNRTTSRNNAQEKAKFEVCNHKYTDLSEPRYGVSLLNDCKYGISVNGSSLRLSLHKGGVRPDYNGDKGLHACTYVFHPHNAGFSSKAVIQPAYCLNYPVLARKGAKEAESFLSLSCDHVIAETIKPCEDTQNAYIVRLYEAEGSYAKTTFQAAHAKELWLTDMLEEPISRLLAQETELSFRPFEIKTIKVVY